MKKALEVVAKINFLKINYLYTKKINLFFLATTVSLFTACNTGKKITKAVSKNEKTISKINISNTSEDSLKIVNETFKKISDNKVTYNTFSAKAKIDYNDPNQNLPDLNGFIRIKTDSCIWVNIELIGITMARILITKDSFYVLDKFHKTYMIKPFSYLQEVAQIPFDFNTIENLLVGNPVYFNKPISSVKTNELTTSVLCVGELFKNLTTVDNSNYLMQHSKLDDIDVNRSRTCDLVYNDYQLKDGKNFSTNRNIIISEKKKVEINLNFKQFKFDEVLTYPFTIPANFKKKD